MKYRIRNKSTGEIDNDDQLVVIKSGVVGYYSIEQVFVEDKEEDYEVEYFVNDVWLTKEDIELACEMWY